MVIKKQFLSIFISIALLVAIMPSYLISNPFEGLQKAAEIGRMWDENKFVTGFLLVVATFCAYKGINYAYRGARGWLSRLQFFNNNNNDLNGDNAYNDNSDDRNDNNFNGDGKVFIYNYVMLNLFQYLVNYKKNHVEKLPTDQYHLNVLVQYSKQQPVTDTTGFSNQIETIKNELLDTITSNKTVNAIVPLGQKQTQPTTVVPKVVNQTIVINPDLLKQLSNSLKKMMAPNSNIAYNGSIVTFRKDNGGNLIINLDGDIKNIEKIINQILYCAKEKDKKILVGSDLPMLTNYSHWKADDVSQQDIVELPVDQKYLKVNGLDDVFFDLVESMLKKINKTNGTKDHRLIEIENSLKVTNIAIDNSRSLHKDFCFNCKNNKNDCQNWLNWFDSLKEDLFNVLSKKDECFEKLGRLIVGIIEYRYVVKLCFWQKIFDKKNDPKEKTFLHLIETFEKNNASDVAVRYLNAKIKHSHDNAYRHTDNKFTFNFDKNNYYHVIIVNLLGGYGKEKSKRKKLSRK